ncbi:MAG: carbohydrate ABC transporter permease, partial [Paenibacillus macerans]|nr:carbohydrate ABC transporter permease [Paenibacillus macerans]
SKIPFRCRTFMFFFILAGLLIPGEATLIPLYQVAKDMEILNTYMGLIFPVLASPFAIIVLKSFFDGIPNDLLESVQMDGGGIWRIFINIMLPLTRPALVSIAILTFIGSWNNFLWPIVILNDPSKYPLAAALTYLNGQFAYNFGWIAAGTMISVLPIIAVFLLTQRYFIEGMSGALKG